MRSYKPFHLMQKVALTAKECCRYSPVVAWAIVSLLTANGLAADGEQQNVAPQKEAVKELTFERHIRPILKTHCVHCHGEAGEKEGELDVRLQRFLVAGGDSGAAIVPGKPEESNLLTRLYDGEMPPDEKKLLPQHEIKLIEEWIRQGAKTARPEPEEIGDGPIITEEERNFWSFQPVERPAVPEVKNSEQARTAVDHFLLRRLEAEGLTYSKEANRRTLIRRATFDLLGLPPTPNEIEAFVADDSPDAYDQLIDRLLLSPHYGERWGRHWLDVAGYADSEGYTASDTIRPFAYKYRNYVVDSFNANMPFDQFVIEQLAGDELAKRPFKNMDPETIRLLTATGFLRMAPDGTGSNPDNQEMARNEVMAETIKIVSSSLMGMTVGCAQCHDHKYDPIPQADYYSLRAVFEPALDWKKWKSPQGRRLSLYTDADHKRAAEVEAEAKKIVDERTKKQTEFIDVTFEKELQKLPEEIHELARAAHKLAAKDRTDEQKALFKKHPSLNISAGSLYLYDRKAADELKKLAEQAAKIREKKPFHDYLRTLVENPGHLPKTFLFYRGDYKQPKKEVVPANLTVLDEKLDPIPVNDETVPTTGRRLAFARQLVNGKHPLVARVMVNRIWQYHFGRGLVSSSSDFGQLGSLPTHPELLDWLADEFVASGWNVKQMHRLIMSSSVYRQSSSRTPKLEEVDPENNLYARMSIRRLAAEDVRDSLLAVSGRFTRKLAGTAVPVREDSIGQIVIGTPTKESGGKYAKGAPLHEEEFRRSVYIQFRRTTPLDMLETFDGPRMQPNCSSRNTSTVTPQALLLMNNDTVHQRAVEFSQRLQTEFGDDLAAQVKQAFQLAWGHVPNDEQLAQAIAFVELQKVEFAEHATPVKEGEKSKEPTAAEQAMASFCHALFSANQFLYVD